MNLNLLWVLWVALFVVLETMGLTGAAGMRPLTFWVIWCIERFGWLVAAAFGWLIYHFWLEPLYRRRDRKDKSDA